MIFKIKQLLNGDNLILFFSFLFILYCTYILSEELIINFRKKRVKYFKYNIFFDINLNALCPYCFSKLKNMAKYNKCQIAKYNCRKCKKDFYLKSMLCCLTVNEAITGIKNDKDASFSFDLNNVTNHPIK